MRIFKRWGREERGRNPAERNDDGVVDSTGDIGTLDGHRGHDGRVTADDA